MKWERTNGMRLRQDYGTIPGTPLGTVRFSFDLGGAGVIADVEAEGGSIKSYILSPTAMLQGLFDLEGVDEVVEVEPRGGVQVIDVSH